MTCHYRTVISSGRSLPLCLAQVLQLCLFLKALLMHCMVCSVTCTELELNCISSSLSSSLRREERLLSLPSIRSE